MSFRDAKRREISFFHGSTRLLAEFTLSEANVLSDSETHMVRGDKWERPLIDGAGLVV